MLHLLPFAEAHANFGAKGRPAQSKSPRHTSYLDELPRTHGENNQFAASRVPNDWGIERHGADASSSLRFDMPSHQQTLEELEMEFKKEATQLARARDQEEDEENYRHREVKVILLPTMTVTLFLYPYFTMLCSLVVSNCYTCYLLCFVHDQKAAASFLTTPRKRFWTH
jgi:hypothetical protein